MLQVANGPQPPARTAALVVDVVSVRGRLAKKFLENSESLCKNQQGQVERGKHRILHAAHHHRAHHASVPNVRSSLRWIIGDDQPLELVKHAMACHDRRQRH